MKLGLNENGVIVNVAEVDPVNIPKHMADWVAGVEVGWTLDGEVWGPPPNSVTQEELKRHAAEMRWRKEVGGIVIGEMFVATDDRSKLLLQGARTAADADPDHVEGWKTSSGDWVDLNAETIIALSNAVRAHVSACFAQERVVAILISTGEITTLAEVEAAFA